MQSMGLLKKLEPYFGLIILVLGIVFYFPFLGSVHLFDWDEINFAESTREMLVTGDYFRVTVDYQPFWEKPPFYFWLQAISMKIFGINEMGARFPNAVFGLLTLLTLYFTGKRIQNALFGFIWSFIFLISFLPFFYFKSGIIDPVFNYFIFASLLLIIRSAKATSIKSKYGLLFLAGLINGLAVLTKGPVGLLLILLTAVVYLILSKFKTKISVLGIFLFLIGMVISSAIWYLPELVNHGPSFLREFIIYQIELFTKPVAGHKQPFYYHFIVVLIGCFPLSIFALSELFRSGKKEDTLTVHKKYMMVLFWVVMILFTVVSTKIVHYSSMAYLPLSFLAAVAIFKSLDREKGIKKWQIVLLGFFGFLFTIALLAIPFAFTHQSLIIPNIKDPFAVEILNQSLNWSGAEYIFGILFLLSVILLVIYLTKKKTLTGIFVYGFLSLSVLVGYLKLVVPKIEKYTQGDLIDFYKSIQGQDVYVTSVGFKTYAYYFYFQQPQYTNQPHGQERQEWLTHGIVDKPVYIVVKITEKYVKELPDVELVKKLGGYVIYKRNPS